jgi:hypothetical protein
MAHTTPTVETGKQTRTQVLLGHLLKRPLQPFVEARRPHTSWAKIALELHALTGIAITGESLRLWYGDTPTERAS